tara:strand:+ start:1784 stop:1987 length:204 start_codon:yes stop_codon:yes gene_type:complete
MSKKTYKVVIEFEYDGDEGAPLTGEPINHPDDAIQAVRDELDAISPYEFIIKATEYIDGELNYGVTG